MSITTLLYRFLSREKPPPLQENKEQTPRFSLKKRFIKKIRETTTGKNSALQRQNKSRALKRKAIDHSMIFSKRLWYDTFSANKHNPAFIHSSYTIPRHFHFINYDLLVYDSLKNALHVSSSPNRTRHIFLSFIFPIQSSASAVYTNDPHPHPILPEHSRHIPAARILSIYQPPASPQQMPASRARAIRTYSDRT